MKRFNILAALVCMFISVAAGAQALKGSYFLDSSLNRHELNPAFAPRANYVQLLGIGNLGVGVMTNIDMPSLLYPQDGKLLTFLHPDVSMKQFDMDFPKHPHLDAEVNTTLLGFGFYTKNKAYWTFDVDVRANVDVDLPGDLFRFAKKGMGVGGGSFNIGNANAYATAGVQASLGYSRNIFDGLRVGIKARAIAPLAYAAVNLENVRLTASEDKWKINTEGYAHAALCGLEVFPVEGSMIPSFDFDPYRMLPDGVIAGIGGSVDIGLEYVLERGTAFDGLSISAAVTDLGVVKYKPEHLYSYSSNGEVEWTGFQDMGLEDFSDVSGRWDEFLEDAQANLLNLTEEKMEGGLLKSTMPRLNVGVEMPFLKRSMSVGLLYSMRKSHSYTRNELTVSYNLTPCKWFALGLNYSFLNTTRTVGFILELTPRIGPAFYIGCDYLPIELAPADFVPYIGMIPTAYRTNINFGIALQTGGKTTKKPKNKK